MDKVQLQELLLEMEAIYPDLLSGLERLRRLVGLWDDLNPTAQARLSTEFERHIGKAQVEYDKLPDFRDRA